MWGEMGLCGVLECGMEVAPQSPRCGEEWDVGMSPIPHLQKKNRGSIQLPWCPPFNLSTSPDQK